MINSFEGNYAFLSNFYFSPIYYDGMAFPSVEHGFQAAKTLDRELRKEFSQNIAPGQAKRLGRRVNLRSDWEEIKIQVMTELVHKKFKNPVLRKKLLDTGEEELVEGNWWHDNFWGDCRCPRCISKKGENHLGQILMAERKKIAEKN